MTLTYVAQKLWLIKAILLKEKLSSHWEVAINLPCFKQTD